MKKIYLLLISMLSIGVANAQFDVTFQVNMSNDIVEASGVHVAGNWQTPVWQPGDNPMTDNGDGTWSLTVSLPADTFEYKFLRGDAWGTDEGVNSDICGAAPGNSNRKMIITGNTTLPLVCYNRCYNCGNNALKVAVAEAPSANMYVAGDYTTPEFSEYTLLSDGDGNAIYDGVISVPNFLPIVQYRFSDGNDGSGFEDITGDCINGNLNRTFAFPLDGDGNGIGDIVVAPFIWGTCTNPTVEVTVQVDMSSYCFNGATPDVRLMGPLNGLGDPDQWGIGFPMTDINNDSIYEATIIKTPSTYEYKFRVGNNGWEDISGNRSVTLTPGVNTTIPVYCFNSIVDGNCPAVEFAPSEVTFQASPGDSTIASGEKMWVFGNFTGYQGGALEMNDDDADGYWSVTVPDLCQVNVLYKFAIGSEYNPSDSLATWSEENADFSALGSCGVDNGGFSDNRIHTRTSAEPITLCYTFNTCDNCVSGLNENTLTNTISIAPNPFSTQTLISVENKEGVALSMNVLDITGKEVKALTNLANNTITIDNRGMSSGMYFLQIFNNNGQKAVKKLIVQ